MTRQRSTGLVLLAGTAVAVCLAVGGDRAVAFRGGGFGGFHGGGFGGFHSGGFGGDRAGNFGGSSHWGGYHGGAPRFGDGGFDDRSTDAGFGRGGYGSVHDASTFDNHADTYRQNHPEYQPGQFQQSHPEARQNASQYQQNRFNEANTLQQNRYNEVNSLNASRYNEARSVQINRQSYNNNWNHWAGGWGGYYSGAGFGAGLAIGATMMALPVAAAAISVAGNPYYYSGGVYYAPQPSGGYVVVPPPQGAVVSTPPPSCSSVNLGSQGLGLDCSGAFYASVSGGYQVIPPPVGATVWNLPNGAVDQTVSGVTYFAYGGAYYRPIYAGSSLYYEVVAKPA